MTALVARHRIRTDRAHGTRCSVLSLKLRWKKFASLTDGPSHHTTLIVSPA
jgi:hypothetical protein